MRVTDLIPWKSGRSSATPATSATSASGERDPVAALQNDVNRAFDNFFLPLPLPFSGWPAAFWTVALASRSMSPRTTRR